MQCKLLHVKGATWRVFLQLLFKHHIGKTGVQELPIVVVYQSGVIILFLKPLSFSCRNNNIVFSL